jgi:hypothetical protein
MSFGNPVGAINSQNDGDSGSSRILRVGSCPGEIVLEQIEHVPIVSTISQRASSDSHTLASCNINAVRSSRARQSSLVESMYVSTTVKQNVSIWERLSHMIPSSKANASRTRIAAICK